MCNCVEETTELIIKRVENQKDVAAVHFALLTSVNAKAGVNVLICYDQKLLNGKTKKKEVTQTIVAAFCPFCGTKYPTDEKG